MSGIHSADRVRPLSYPDRSLRERRIRALRLAFGVPYVVGAGVHIGIVSADPDQYRPFAQGAVPPIRDAWLTVFMAAPAGWGLAVAVGELLIGMMLLLGGRSATRTAVGAAIAFHLALLLFGWWAWFYAVPALVLLGHLIHLLIQDTGAGIRVRVPVHRDLWPLGRRG